MTFAAPQRFVRFATVIRRDLAETIARSQRRAIGATTHRLGWAFVLIASLVLHAGCTPTTYSVMRDPPDYVDRVLEDVTAIVEGMANAHARDRVVYHDPGIRSSR